MNFIARNIPVPRVLDNLIQEYIARARRRVEPDGFRRSKSCMSQLQRYLEQLCALIPPEPGRVQAVEQDVWMTDCTLLNGDRLIALINLTPSSTMT